MLSGVDTHSTGGENDVFPSSLGLRLSIQHCITGEGGSQLLFLQRKKDWGRKFYHCMGVPRTLADIVVVRLLQGLTFSHLKHLASYFSLHTNISSAVKDGLVKSVSNFWKKQSITSDLPTWVQVK